MKLKFNLTVPSTSIPNCKTFELQWKCSIKYMSFQDLRLKIDFLHKQFENRGLRVDSNFFNALYILWSQTLHSLNNLDIFCLINYHVLRTRVYRLHVAYALENVLPKVVFDVFLCYLCFKDLAIEGGVLSYLVYSSVTILDCLNYLNWHVVENNITLVYIKYIVGTIGTTNAVIYVMYTRE